MCAHCTVQMQMCRMLIFRFFFFLCTWHFNKKSLVYISFHFLTQIKNMRESKRSDKKTYTKNEKKTEGTESDTRIEIRNIVWTYILINTSTFFTPNFFFSFCFIILVFSLHLVQVDECLSPQNSSFESYEKHNNFAKWE